MPVRQPTEPQQTPESADTAWFRCEGEMAERIRAFDWHATPLGPMDRWPDALRFCLNLLLPSRAQMVLFWGPDRLAFYNDAYAPTIGHKHPHVLGRPAREGWAELWDDLGPLLDAVLERGETVSAADRPFKIDRAGYLEDVFFDISYSPVRGPRGEVAGALCMVTETTGRIMAVRRLAESEAAVRAAAERLEQRVAERTRALVETQETLRQAQKMEAVGQLTGGLAHDFNNLLGTIGNSLQLMQLRLARGEPQELERYVGLADDAVRRAAALTHRLLAFSRKQTLEPQALDVNRLVRGMEELIRRTMGPGIDIGIACDAPLWTVRLDASQLENSLLNLCLNARDAMPGGGDLRIATGNAVLDADAAHRLGLPAGEYVVLSVTDSGEGMPPDVVRRIFDPFYTTKPIGVGTGLGLSMVYGFVRQSGGQVQVSSAPGQGTTLCLYLPRHIGPPAEERAPPAAALVPGAGETLLVVDDEQGIRVTAQALLQHAGYRVRTAANGSEGLRALEDEPGVALLITDVGLPGGMNGRQLAEQARLRRPALPVLFITGYDNAAVSDGTLAPGMSVLTKPFELSALAQRVRALIEAGGTGRAH